MGCTRLCGLYLQKHTLACGRLQVSAGFLDSQCEGREFDPPPLHHYFSAQPFSVGRFPLVRPAGRTHLEVKVLYSPGKGKS